MAPDVRAVEGLVVLDRALVQYSTAVVCPTLGALATKGPCTGQGPAAAAPMGAVYREEGQPNDNVRRFRMVSEVGANAFAAFQARTVAAV
eukprot:COSAG06_NODE_1296_length_9960_cov_2.570009_5_plen_90_part_00